MKKINEHSQINRRQVIALLGGAAVVGTGVGGGIIWWNNRPSSNTSTPQLSFPRAASTGKVQPYTLTAAPIQVQLGKKTISTWGYNNTLPGPEIRATEGDTLRVTVQNQLSAGTTIHWHGVPLVNAMDGVDGVTQDPIKAGGTFTYDYIAPVAGTYFYHSHVGLQLDRGLYGPLIIESAKEAKHYDQDVVLVLDDFLDGLMGGPATPEDAMKQLIASGDGMSNMNGMMSQVPPDLLYPAYLVNGKASDDPFEIVVKKGQRIRLRLINASAATIYHIALQGHRLTVTHTDGQPVEPVQVDALRIGMGERYDILVDTNNPGLWQFAALVEGTQRMGRAIVRYTDNTSALPPADFQPPELTRQMLTYPMLKAAPGIVVPPADTPDQIVPLQLSGGMGQYVWKINNQVFPHADRIMVQQKRLISFQFDNQSMMPHPMHLHGHFFQLNNGTGRGPLKDTVIIDTMQKMTVNWVSDNPGLWAFHCHNAYHQSAGMMHVVQVNT